MKPVQNLPVAQRKCKWFYDNTETGRSGCINPYAQHAHSFSCREVEINGQNRCIAYMTLRGGLCPWQCVPSSFDLCQFIEV